MTPPISLKDFEEFLCFRTKSAENLYFESWLRQYAALYNQATPSLRSHGAYMSLQESYKTALDVFFSSSSPLELNLPADVRRDLDQHFRTVSQGSGAPETFLPPDAFAQAHHETSESLARSFKQFLLQVSRNADRNRARFAMFLGALTWALGLVPTSKLSSVIKCSGERDLTFISSQLSALCSTSIALGGVSAYSSGGSVQWSS